MNKYKILILDDDASILNALKSIFQMEGYEVYCAENGETAIDILMKFKPDLYILDVFLKEENGIEFLKKIREDLKITEPAIILTGFPSTEIFQSGYKLSCDFFLQKNKAIPDILSVVYRLIKQSNIRKKILEKDESLSLKTIAYLIELIKANKDLYRILIKIDAYPLFELQNILKNDFNSILEKMLFDFLYNLYEQIPPKEIEAQVTESGADLIVSIICPSKEENKIREKVKTAIIKTIKFMRNKIKDNFHFFDVKIIPFKSKDKNIRLELFHCLQMKGKIEPIPINSLNYNFYHQGIFETNTLTLKGFEIFIRPNGLENVEKFYRKLESLHIHGHMDGSNIKKIKKLIPLFYPNFFISINLSPSSLLINKFSRYLISQLGSYSRNIYLEFTERTPYLTNKIIKEKILYLKKNGFLIAIDDVGAGYNNISAILNIEPNLIKIDKILVKGISKDKYKREGFISILKLSKKIGSLVCAEGVEREDDFLILKDLKPDYMQGFYLHCPEKIKDDLEERKVI